MVVACIRNAGKKKTFLGCIKMEYFRSEEGGETQRNLENNNRKRDDRIGQKLEWTEMTHLGQNWMAEAKLCLCFTRSWDHDVGWFPNSRRIGDEYGTQKCYWARSDLWQGHPAHFMLWNVLCRKIAQILGCVKLIIQDHIVFLSVELSENDSHILETGRPLPCTTGCIADGMFRNFKVLNCSL